MTANNAPDIEDDPSNASGARRRGTALWLAAALATTNVVLLLLSDAPSLTPRYICASLLLWLSAYPTWRYFSSHERQIPFLPAMTAVYFFYYGLPAFDRNLKVNNLRLDGTPADTAVALACMGEALLLLAFYGPKLTTKLPRARMALDLRSNAPRFLVLAYAFAGIRVLLLKLQLPLESAGVAHFVTLLPAVFLSGLFLCFLRKQLSRLMSVSSAALLLTLLIVDFGTGFLAQPLLTLTPLFFVYVAERRRIPLAALAIIAIIVIPSMGTKTEYRKIIKANPELGIVERAGIFAELAAGVFSGGKMTFLDASDVAQDRIDHLSAFAYVVVRTPESVPYWGGTTYASFFWSFIPRFLYPDKPHKTLGQEYGHRYQFLGRRNLTTSINLEQTVEMYANFGILGVLIGMFLMGLLYRALYYFINHPAIGDGGLLVAACIFRSLLNIESDFSLVFGSILQTALLLYLILYLVAGPMKGCGSHPDHAARTG